MDTFTIRQENMSLYKDPNSPHCMPLSVSQESALDKALALPTGRKRNESMTNLSWSMGKKNSRRNMAGCCIDWLTAEPRNTSDRYRIRALPIPTSLGRPLASSVIEQCLSPVPSTYNREAQLVAAILNLPSARGI